MTTPGPDGGSQPESSHTVLSSPLSLPPPSSHPHPSNPATLAHPQPEPEPNPQPSVPLVVSSSPLSLPPPSSPPRSISPISPHPSPGPCPRQLSVQTLPKEHTTSNSASFTTTDITAKPVYLPVKPILTDAPEPTGSSKPKKVPSRKPTYAEVASLYQYMYDRIDDLKIITGALCEQIIALEDTVAALSEEDTMGTFMKTAHDMAREGQVIAMLAEEFSETGTKIAERGTEVELDYLKSGVDRRPDRNAKPRDEEGDGNANGVGGNAEERDGNKIDNDNEKKK